MDDKIKEKDDERRERASDDFRKNACYLRARIYEIPLYRIWEFLKFVPKFENALKIVKLNMGFSNSFHNASENARKEIKEDIKEFELLLKNFFKNYKI